MHYKIFISLIFFLAAFCGPSYSQKGIEKKDVYAALSSSSLSLLDAQLSKVQSSGIKERIAYEGALLMRKADLVSVPVKKLSFFKQGHKKLEASIAGNKANAEYRFLRLMIQEHAPKSLGYNKNISEDSKIIAANYKSLSSILKNIILDYSKKSKALPSSAL